MKFESHLLTLLLFTASPGSAFLSAQQKSALVGRSGGALHLRDRHDSTRLLASLPRRDFIAGTAGLTAATGAAPASSAASVATGLEPIADLPMIRLKLPSGGFGREYVAIKLKINGQGPFDFMLDTGLTTEFITPHLQQSLGIKAEGSSIRGLAAGGEGASSSLVELQGASLCCGKFNAPAGESELPLPPLHAIITDFPQEHIDPAHDPVEGMLGMEMLSLFDVDFDFAKGRVRFWEPGTAAKAVGGLVEIPAVVINETGLIGIRLVTPNSQQPILGFLDCGSSFSTVNWLAASYLGLPPKEDPVYKKSVSIMALGIDGRPMQLPTISQALTFVGNVVKDPSTGRPMGFENPPSNWKPWAPVQMAIGDIPAFQTVLGDGVTPYKGPAALIGLDVLAQRRVIFETGTDGTRRRRLLVGPK